MKLDILAIGAHPDDIELSCGGTIIKLVKQGRRVGILDLTQGELGTRGDRKTRAQESARAAGIMGVALRENLKLPDGNIESHLDNRMKLVRVLRALQPDIILFPYPVDRHPDHERAHVLCREAWFTAGLQKVRTSVRGKSQDPFRPRAYYHFMQWYEFAPSFIIDVSAEFDQRMETMRAYRSQFYDPASRERETVLSTPEFLEMIRTRLEYYGDRIGKKYGEPFFSPASLEVKDMFTLNT
ncbi:MAG TPA: bacillithiol biosynthesis deacetylase BshB1 [Bacteroidota bacterium]|nr:bacillithiol biosynthesis deacetylase BshB1 [Bacteroidota bacterium]